MQHNIFGTAATPGISTLEVKNHQSAIHCCSWLILSVHTGSHCWFTLLVHTAGSHCWFTPLVHSAGGTAGSHCWFTPLVHSAGGKAPAVEARACASKLNALRSRITLLRRLAKEASSSPPPSAYRARLARRSPLLEARKKKATWADDGMQRGGG